MFSNDFEWRLSKKRRWSWSFSLRSDLDCRFLNDIKLSWQRHLTLIWQTIINIKRLLLPRILQTKLLQFIIILIITKAERSARERGALVNKKERNYRILRESADERIVVVFDVVNLAKLLLKYLAKICETRDDRWRGRNKEDPIRCSREKKKLVRGLAGDGDGETYLTNGEVH